MNNDGIPGEVVVEAEKYALRELRLDGIVSCISAIPVGQSIPMTTSELFFHLRAAFIAGRLTNSE